MTLMSAITVLCKNTDLNIIISKLIKLFYYHYIKNYKLCNYFPLTFIQTCTHLSDQSILNLNYYTFGMNTLALYVIF